MLVAWVHSLQSVSAWSAWLFSNKDVANYLQKVNTDCINFKVIPRLVTELLESIVQTSGNSQKYNRNNRVTAMTVMAVSAELIFRPFGFGNKK